MPERRPFHLAVHYLGCARAVGGGVALPGHVGSHVEALAARVDRVVILAYDPPDPPGFEDRTDLVVEAANVSFVSLGPKGGWREMLARRRRVIETLERHAGEWDVLMLRLPNRRVGPFGSHIRRGRIVAQVVGHAPSVLRELGGPLWRKAPRVVAAWNAERLQRRLVATSGLAVANSESNVKRYATSRPDVLLVRTSTRSEEFRHRATDRMDGAVVNLLLCGRVAAAKGIFEAIEAFAKLRAGALPHAHLHIVGDGEDRRALERRAGELGVMSHCTFHGWVSSGPALFDLYARMDVLLHPSYAESFPRTVWEAMAHSVLVVCTAVGGLGDAFDDGADVLFVPVRRPDLLVAALERLAAEPDLRERLLRRGYDRAQEASLESVSERLLDAIVTRWPELAVTTGDG
jgi:glycosyltransferase involved in cell wall biosynthesis